MTVTTTEPTAGDRPTTDAPTAADGWPLIGRYGPVLGPLMLAAIGLVDLGRKGVWLDEAYTWSIVDQPTFSRFIDALDLTVSNMFGYMAIVRLVASVGDGAVALRLPSLMFAVLTVVAVWAIARRVATPNAAGAAALLAGASVPLTFYGLEARSYAMLACLSALSWLVLLRALDDDRPRHWVLLGLVTFGALSAHVIALLALPSIGVVVLMRHRIDRALLRLLPTGAAAAVCLALIALSTPRDAAGFPPPLSLEVIVRSARLLAGDHGVFTRDGSGFVLMLLFLTLFALAAIRQLQERPDRNDRSWIIWIWFLGPPLTTLVVSVVEPLLWHRMLIGSLPAAFVIVGTYLADTRRRTVALATLFLIVILGFVRTERIADDDLWEFEALAGELRERSQPGDVLSFTQPWERVGLDYYFRDEPDRFVAAPPMGPVLDYGEITQNAELLTERVTGDRIWLIDGADGAPVWKGDLPSDDEFVFDEAVDLLPASATLIDRFELGRFSVRLYEVG
ncbi:MAG: glycosyltransferase family 39 protein [Acidimicrobiales bacterium]